MTTSVLERANAACEALTEGEDALTREVITRFADKWSLWTLSVLAQGNGPLRFSRVLERVEGVDRPGDAGACRAASVKRFQAARATYDQANRNA